MAFTKDSQGNVIDNLDKVGGSSLNDSRPATVIIGAVQAETVIDCANTNSIAIDVRGAFVLTLVAEYCIDGVTYNDLPIFNPNAEVFVPGITAVGSYIGHLPSGTKKVRVRCSAYTSGSATVALRGSQGDNFIYAKPIPTTSCITTTAAAGAASTATLPAPGAGLFHYITRVKIQRFASALLTAGAAPVVVTTTNLPGTRAFSFPADAAAQGVIFEETVEMNNPIKSSVANTATTIVAPATTAVIWRITVDYYIGK